MNYFLLKHQSSNGIVCSTDTILKYLDKDLTAAWFINQKSVVSQVPAVVLGELISRAGGFIEYLV